MSNVPNCPQCTSSFAYEDQFMFVCPECAHEWPQKSDITPTEESDTVVKDASGNILKDGDTVCVIKDLKFKGSGGGVVKSGTKVKNIRIVAGDHDIDCKIDGFGAMQLKSEFVRKQ